MTMNDVLTRIRSERDRLQRSVSAKPAGILVKFRIECGSSAKAVETRIQSVLKAVDDATLAGWPSDGNRSPALPDWFVSVFGPELSPEEAEQWLASWKELSPEGKIKADLERKWSISDWLYWMEPENRQWFFWKSNATDERTLTAEMEVDGWPFPWSALRWLFLAAGGTEVSAE